MPNFIYSCFYSKGRWFPGQEEREMAKSRLEKAKSDYEAMIGAVVGDRLAEWVLMGKKHPSGSSTAKHWTVRAFCGDHAVLTFHLPEDASMPAELYVNGGEWGGRRSRVEFVCLPW